MAIVIDVVFVLLMALIFFFGFRKGFLTKGWWLLDLGLIVLFGIFVSPSIKQALAENTSILTKLESAFESLIGSGKIINMDAAGFASFVLYLIIWVVLGIIIIILMAILKHFLRKLNKYKPCNLIDKIFGGIYSVVIALIVFLAVGVVLGTFTNFSPIQKAYDLCGDSYVFKYIFGENPFQNFVNEKFPLGTWVGNVFK